MCKQSVKYNHFSVVFYWVSSITLSGLKTHGHFINNVYQV